MLMKLIVLFVAVPFMEMLILIELGMVMGFWFTVALIALTGLLGAILTRMEGICVVMRIRDELKMGNLPAEDLIDGLLILVAGIVLITPGLLTDILGFCLLVPRVRVHIKRWLRIKCEEFIEHGTVQIAFFH